MVSDTTADVLTRIRNAQKAGHASVKIPLSKAAFSVLSVLKREGFVADFKEIEPDKSIVINNRLRAANLKKRFGSYNVVLKYYQNGDPLIRLIDRVSKPGFRKYAGVDGIQKVYSGLGISIVSTSQGVLSDREAKRLGIGGEVLARVG